MLMVQGTCLRCWEIKGVSKVDGKPYSFNRARIFNQNSLDDPVTVTLGKRTLERRKTYYFQVWVSPFVSSNGKAGYDLRVTEETSLQELKSQ